MQAGQKLSRHIRRESKEADLERKLAHIEQFGPILIEYLGKITGAKDARKKKAEEGLKKLLGRDSQAAEKDLSDAEVRLNALKEKQAKAGLLFSASANEGDPEDMNDMEVAEIVEIEVGDDDSTTSTSRTRVNKAAEKALAKDGTVKKALTGTTSKAAAGTE